MRTLVLGSKGFVGSAFRRSPYFQDACFDSTRFECSEDLQRILSGVKPDTIVNVIGSGILPDQRGNGDAVVLANVEVTRWLLDWVGQQPGLRVVHFGSWFEDLPNLTDAYTRSKREASSLIRTCSHPERVLQVKLHHVYGYGEAESRLVPWLVKCVRDGENPVLNDPSGSRSFLWADDIPSLVANRLAHGHRQAELRGDGPWSNSEVLSMVEGLVRGGSAVPARAPDGCTSLWAGLSLLLLEPRVVEDAPRI